MSRTGVTKSSQRPPWSNRFVILSLVMATSSLIVLLTSNGVSANALSPMSTRIGFATTGSRTLTGSGEVKMSLRMDVKRSCPVKFVKQYGGMTFTIYFEYPNSTTGTYEPDIVYQAKRFGTSSAVGTPLFYSKAAGTPPETWYWWSGISGTLTVKSNWTGSFNMKAGPASGNPGAAKGTEIVTGSWSCAKTK